MAISQFPSKGGIPSGNTAARPGSPVIGDTFYNGQLAQLEIYDGTTWRPASAPAATPVITSVTDVGTNRAFNNGAVTVAFVAGANGGIVNDFTAYAGTSNATGASSPITVTNLVGGTSVNVSVVANNNYANSAASLLSTITPTTVPAAPTGVSATVVGGIATVSWTAPNNGGKTLTGYTIASVSGGFTASAAGDATSGTVSGLVGGTSYTFTVTATNANGNSAASTASNSVTAVQPIELLVVGAGGGGGGAETNQAGGQGGGGGGGAYRYDTNFPLTPATTFSITVGSGGSGGVTGSGDSATSGTKGGNSTFGSVTAEGGGLGGGDAQAGGVGGSAGGSGGDNSTVTQPTNILYGNAGGSYASRSGKGGGGKGSAGGSTVPTGGAAESNSITGTAEFYSGGGGGGKNSGESGAATGGTNAGNGGNGNAGGNGTANFGGGGGGGSASGSGGNGGAGVVIARVPTSLTSELTVTGSPTTTTSGSFTIYKWTGSGSLVRA